MPNSRTSPSSGIYSLRHWALTFKLTQQQIKTTRFAHHWDTTIRCRYFCRHRFYSRLTTPHRRTPISGRVSRPDLAPVSFSSFPFFARRYNSSALTSRWGCGDGYPLKTRSSAETHLFGIPAVHCTGSSLRTVSEQSPLSPSGFAN